MDLRTASQFNKVSGIKTEEMFGDCMVDIEAGSFCIFDQNAPTNGLHYHNCYEVCIVTGGSGEFLHDNKTYLLYEGDVFVANPGVAHEIRMRQKNRARSVDNLYLVFFRIHIHSNTTTSTSSNLHEERMLKEFLFSHLIISRAQKHILSYLHFIDHYVESTTQVHYGLLQAVKNIALESIFSLVKANENQSPKPFPVNTIVDQAMNYIQVNLNRRILLSEVASHTCTSERNLQYAFKKYMNTTVTDYINLRKMVLAAGYLKMNFKISDICTLIGINNLPQFSRLFKKYYGISPKKYQMTYSPAGMVSGAFFKAEPIDNIEG